MVEVKDDTMRKLLKLLNETGFVEQSVKQYLSKEDLEEIKRVEDKLYFGDKK